MNLDRGHYKLDFYQIRVRMSFVNKRIKRENNWVINVINFLGYKQKEDKIKNYNSLTLLYRHGRKRTGVGQRKPYRKDETVGSN